MIRCQRACALVAALLFAVWDFFGDEESFASDGSVVDEVLNSQRSYLTTFNAVGRSVIDRALGGLLIAITI